MSYKRIKTHLAISAFFVCVLMVSFYDVFFLGKTFKVTTANSQALPSGAYGQENNRPKFIPVNGTDSPVQEEPIFHFIRKNLWRGILPLWNPHQACGYPLIAMIEVGMFFPVNWIMYLFPETVSWDILILTRLFLAGIFVYIFMRTMGFAKAPALTSGIVFMLSGPMLLLQYWTANVDILAPLLLVAYERLLRAPKASSIGFLGLMFGMTVWAGHPEHIFLVNAYAFSFFLFRCFCLRNKLKIVPLLFSLFWAALLGFGLSAITLFPFLQNFQGEFWHGHPGGVGLLMEEQRERALTLAIPHFFQEVPLTFRWVFAGWWGGYLGALPLALSFLSLWRRHKKGLNYFSFGAALVIIGKQYGLPVINLIGHLPLFNLCRYAIHTPVLAALSVAILSGMGLRTVLALKKTFLRGLVFCAGLGLIIAAHFIFMHDELVMPTALKATLFTSGILAIFQIILWLKDKRLISGKLAVLFIGLLVFCELFLYIHRERPYRFASFGKVPYIEFIKSPSQRVRSYGNFWAFYPNTATGFEADDLGFFFGLVPKRFVAFTNTLILKNYFKRDLRPPALRAMPIQAQDHILDLLNVRYIITPATEKYVNRFSHLRDIRQDLKKVYSKEVDIYQRPDTFPRAFIVSRVIFEPDPRRALAIIQKLESHLRHAAVINHAPIPALMQLLKDNPAENPAQANIVKYTANEVIVEAHLAHPGFLILSDAFHPDWKVTVNHKRWPVFQANYLLRAVFLPKGRFQVRFTFEPRSFYGGAFVSLLSLSIIFFLCLPRFKRKK